MEHSGQLLHAVRIASGILSHFDNALYICKIGLNYTGEQLPMQNRKKKFKKTNAAQQNNRKNITIKITLTQLHIS